MRAQSLITIKKSKVEIPKSLLRHLLHCLEKFQSASLEDPGALIFLNTPGLAGFVGLLTEHIGCDANLWQAEALCRYLLALGQ